MIHTCASGHCWISRVQSWMDVKMVNICCARAPMLSTEEATWVCTSANSLDLQRSFLAIALSTSVAACPNKQTNPFAFLSTSYQSTTLQKVLPSSLKHHSRRWKTDTPHTTNGLPNLLGQTMEIVKKLRGTSLSYWIVTGQVCRARFLLDGSHSRGSQELSSAL